MMRRRGGGYHEAVIEGVKPGARYLYRLDRLKEFPDPASRFQPDGVHGASEVVGERFGWRDEGWAGVPLRDYILYELHVGTFTVGCHTPSPNRFARRAASLRRATA
jgi:maltooligosyltrehalose trehalohydrolase